MATAAARSPSHGPTRSPSPCCAAMRRSADSIPFKPSDCPQRRSKSGGGCGCHTSPRTSFGEKENDQRDAARATPKARGSGGTKNFMAPTISAASKAVNAAASPRKKVLGERNEHHNLAPSSPADLVHKPRGPSDGDLADIPKGPLEAGACMGRMRLSFDGAAPSAAPEASHGSRHSFGGEEARIKNPVSVCKGQPDAMTKPVDAEPHAMANPGDAETSRAAPYDPKTNYLSPRPRFLRYKPNRIEMYRHYGRRLEDGFVSESSDETDMATREEDELTEEEHEQAQQKPEPNDLPEEPYETHVLPPAVVLTSEPAVTSPRALAQTPGQELELGASFREEEREQAQQKPEPNDLPEELSAQAAPSESHVLQPAVVLDSEPEPELGESSVRVPAKERSRRRFVLAAPLALLLFMAAAFVCVPPPPDSPLMSKVSDFLSVQELHSVELAAWLKHWSSSSLYSITSYWDALAFTRVQECFGPQFTANLSDSNIDADHGTDLDYHFAETWQMPREEPIGVGVFEVIQGVVLESNIDLTAELEAVDVAMGEDSIDAAAAYDYKVIEELDVEMSEEVPGNNGEEMSSFSQNMDSPSHPTKEPEQIEMEKQDVETDESEDDHANGQDDQEAYRGLKLDSSMWPAYLDKISDPAAVVIALFAVILATGMAVIFARKRKQAQVSVNTNVPTEQAEEAVTQSISGSSDGHLVVKSSQLQTSMSEETEKFGDSGFYQYSSSLSSSHGRRRKAKEVESPSLEPMSKRESMTSTSSYGSFTTYEKISAKKKNKEDDVMTPVRRSSRLRSVKSPEA